MSEKILIYGKNTWPYTNAAREAYKQEGKTVEYHDVLSDANKLDTMLKHSDGARKVPVIIDGDDVTIGFDGKTWGIWSTRLEAESNQRFKV